MKISSDTHGFTIRDLPVATGNYSLDLRLPSGEFVSVKGVRGEADHALQGHIDQISRGSLVPVEPEVLLRASVRRMYRQIMAGNHF